MSTALRILRMLAPRRALAIGAFLCMVAGAATTVAYAFLAGPFLAAVHGGESAARLPFASWLPPLPGGAATAVAATVLAVTVARALASYGQRILTARVGQDVVRRLRETMYAHLLEAVPSALLTQRRGEIASRLASDVLQVQTLVSSNLASVAADLVALGGLIVLAFSLDVQLACIALAAVPPIAVIVWRLAGVVRRVHREVWEQYGQLSATAADLVDTVPVIRAYAAEALALGSFVERAQELERRTIRAQRWSGLGGPVVQILGGLALVSALILSAGRLASGELAVETFVSFFAAMFFVYRPVQGLGATVHRVASGLAALDRVDEVLAMPVEPPDAPGAKELGPMRDALVLEGVGFAYREGAPVLEGIDLEVRRGESLAIVGKSGAGKSTLLRLILGLARPSAGEVRIDGVSVDDATRASWRRQLAWVTQEPLIFADSVLANIAPADPEPDRTRAREALGAAGALDFVDALPSGIDSVLSEGGKELSGGQRQRLCIARALYKESPILLFDEATSSLDGPSERAIAETIEALMAERTGIRSAASDGMPARSAGAGVGSPSRSGATMILVSHRMSSVRRADRVVVIEGGRIVEAGPPEVLWKTEGRFFALFEDATIQ